MIREEFLATAAENNLIMLRSLRDVAVILAAGSHDGIRGLSAYERIRFCAEMELRDAAEASAGLVRLGLSVLTPHTVAAENKTSALVGLSLPKDVTAFERKCLARSTPPVGKLPQIYESVRASAAAVAAIAAMLTERIAALYDNMASAKVRFDLPLSAVEAFGKTVDDCAQTAVDMGKDTVRKVTCDADSLDKFRLTLQSSFDPFYETETRAALAEKVDADTLSRITDDVLHGSKTTALPLFFDFVCRYSALPEAKQ